jgi:hypothetical protein
MDEKERDRVPFWFVQAGRWGRFSGSTELFIDRNLAALEDPDGGPDKFLDQLRLWHGGLRVGPGHLTDWSLGASLCPVLYLITRTGGSRDWEVWIPSRGEYDREYEPPRSAPHDPVGSALQAKARKPWVGERRREPLLPHKKATSASAPAYPGTLSSKSRKPTPMQWIVGSSSAKDVVQSHRSLPCCLETQIKRKSQERETPGSRRPESWTSLTTYCD